MTTTLQFPAPVTSTTVVAPAPAGSPAPQPARPGAGPLRIPQEGGQEQGRAAGGHCRISMGYLG